MNGNSLRYLAVSIYGRRSNPDGQALQKEALSDTPGVTGPYRKIRNPATCSTLPPPHPWRRLPGKRYRHASTLHRGGEIHQRVVVAPTPAVGTTYPPPDDSAALPEADSAGAVSAPARPRPQGEPTYSPACTLLSQRQECPGQMTLLILGGVFDDVVVEVWRDAVKRPAVHRLVEVDSDEIHSFFLAPAVSAARGSSSRPC